jgi:hypothetical protein
MRLGTILSQKAKKPAHAQPRRLPRPVVVRPERKTVLTFLDIPAIPYFFKGKGRFFWTGLLRSCAEAVWDKSVGERVNTLLRICVSVSERLK